MELTFSWLYGAAGGWECPSCGHPVQVRYESSISVMAEHITRWCGVQGDLDAFRTAARRAAETRQAELNRVAPERVVLTPHGYQVLE